MAATVFAVFVLAGLAMLTATEIVRYRRATEDADAFPYPRRRLARRIGIALLLGLVVLLAAVWPEEAPTRVRVGLIFVILLLFMVCVVLLLRDLHETSKAVVAKSNELSLRAARNLEQLIRSTQADASASPAASSPPDADDKTPPASDSPASEK